MKSLRDCLCCVVLAGAAMSSHEDANVVSVKAYYGALFDLVKNATLEELLHILVFEEKLVFLCTFRKQFQELLSVPRCGNHLFTHNEGGVLILGTDSPTPEGNAIVEADRSSAFAATSSIKSAMYRVCTDALMQSLCLFCNAPCHSGDAIPLSLS